MPTVSGRARTVDRTGARHCRRGLPRGRGAPKRAPGDARPEEDEKIEFRLVKLNEVLKMIDKGEIKDGKTLTSVLLYSRKTRRKGKK